MKAVSAGHGRLNDWLHWWGPPLVVMLAIFVSSSLPSQSLPRLEGWLETAVKKGGHALGYALLALTVRRALARGGPAGARVGWRSLGWVVAYALSDEYHQTFTPGRSASVVDVGIDVFGAGLSLIAMESLRRRDH